ncbi:MAG: lipid-A-disaccharide synthase [Elusimicrobiota bacterium]
MHFLIVAGDPSGDLYGAMLARELRALDPEARFSAVGGRFLREEAAAGGRFLHDLASLGITGFLEPLRNLFLFLDIDRRIRDLLRKDRPDAVVCVDFYGFNRHVLKAARAEGVTTCYFISPQVWATRPGRIRALKELVDRMIVIFPFEEKLYREAGVPVTWVGHPLLDVLPPPRNGGSGEESSALKVGLLPGSRLSEIRRHLPVFLGALRRILRDYPRCEASLFASAQVPDAVYEEFLLPWRAAGGLEVKIVREADYRERSGLDIALTSSGTATLENALLGVPMVVIYKLFWPTYAIARAMIRVPYITMANLLCGKRLVPELVQAEADAPGVAREALLILEDPRRLSGLRKELSALRGLLGGPGAARRAAEAVLETAGSKRSVP